MSDPQPAKPRRQPSVITYQPVPVPGTSIVLRRREGPAHPLVPVVDPGYVWREDILQQAAYAVNYNENCLLVGGAGTGKSSLVEQMAALTNTPLVRINVHGESDPGQFLGREVPQEVDGVRRLVYQWGVLPRAMAEGWWLLIDELDAALQPVLFCLQSALEDQGRITLDDGLATVVRRHPEFRIFATANTVGIAGRHRVMYTGTLSRLNEATLDRFGTMVHVPEPTPALEEQLLANKVPGLPLPVIAAVVRVANEIRHQLQNEELACTFSTRRCLQWARAMLVFQPLDAARIAITNKLSAEDAEVVAGVIQRFFGGGK